MSDDVRDRQFGWSDVRLNLGCGTTAPDGWTNLDRSPGIFLDRVPGLSTLMSAARLLPAERANVRWPSNVRRWDVRRGLRYPTGSVRVIYTSHMLEHLSKRAGDAFLAECRRVLRPDGVLRVAVPDLEKAVDAYTASDGDPSSADTFMETTLLGVEEDPKGWGRLVAAASGAAHKWMYDAASLRRACLKAGFGRAERFRFREGRCPDLSSVETREDSVFIEAYVGQDAALRPPDGLEDR